MDYKNEICQGCNQPIKENDDIVVCPVCGTPQHRDCWSENNDCVNASLHSENFIWQKTQPDEPKPEPQVEQEPAKKVTFVGTAPVLDQLSQETQNLESLFLRDQVLHKDETIDGVSVVDAGYYLQSGAHRYIRRFRKNKKLTWNWGAFLFAPAWFFYRKLYKFGALFLALVVSVNLFSYSLYKKIDIQSQEVYTVVEQCISDNSDSPASDEKLTPETFTGNFIERANAMSVYFMVSAISQYSAKKIDPLAVSKVLVSDREFMADYTSMIKNENIYLVITTLIPAIFAALIADKLIKKKMKEDISAAKEATDDLQLQRSIMISKGGVAPLIFAIVYFASQYLVSILMNIGAAVVEWFN